MSDETSRVLVVTADDLLVAEVARLAAAAGANLVVEREPAVALRSWSASPVVLLGADVLGRLASLRPPRRDRVFLVGAQLPDAAFREALACGVEGTIRLPEEEAWAIQLLTDVGDGAPVPGLTIGVIGGAGGVGSSTFAAALAVSCSHRRSAVVVDADAYGSGIDQILGLDPGAGLRWDSLLRSTGRLSGRSIRDALPVRDGLAVLGWPVDRAPVVDLSAAREVLSAASRGFDSVVIDLPRHPDAVSEEFLLRCERVLVVTTTTVPTLAATARVVARLAGFDVGMIVRRRPGGLDSDEVARFLGRPVLVTMSDQRGLDEDVGLGVGPVRRSRGPLARAADRVTAALLDARGGPA